MWRKPSDTRLRIQEGVRTLRPFWRRRPKEPIRHGVGRLDYGIKVVLGALSLLGIALMFLGFGVSIALGSYGIDVHQVLHGPGDYLAASAYVLSRQVVEVLSDEWLGGAWFTPLAIYTMLVGMGVLSLWALILAFGALVERAGATVKRAVQRTHSWLRPRPHCWRPPVIAGVVAAGGGLLAMLPYLVTALTVLFVTPFFIGMSWTSQYLYEYVVEPTDCWKPATAKDRRLAYVDQRINGVSPTRRPYRAMCLRVDRKGEKALFGRRVIATSETVVLFDPDSGAVNVVPTKDAVVSVVGSLSAASNPDAKPAVPATPAPRPPARKKPLRTSHR